MGGDISKAREKDAETIKDATHAIILCATSFDDGTNPQDVIADWEKFFVDEAGLELLVVINSDYTATEDNVNTERLTVHHLDRKVDYFELRERPAIKYVSDMLIELAPPALPKNEKIVTENGYKFRGGYSTYEISEEVIRAYKEGRPNLLFHCELGDVPITKIPTDEEMFAYDFFDRPLILANNQVILNSKLNKAQNIALPEDLHQIQLPAVPKGCDLTINGNFPNWFLPSVVLSYTDTVATISLPTDRSDPDNFRSKKLVGSMKTKVVYRRNCPTLFIDMDGVLADFDKERQWIKSEQPELEEEYGEIKNIPGLFAKLEPMPGAVEAVKELHESGKFTLYVLSSSPWLNLTAASEKEAWIKKYFGEGEDSPFYKRITLTHQKDLVIGDYLVDDMKRNGSDKFPGKHIHFGQTGENGEDWTDWENVTKWLRERV
jgi:5'(3')-deoxyribonucleotidase